MAKMTPMMGTYTSNIPRLLVPVAAARKWKSEKDWDVVRKAAGMPFSPKGGSDEQPRFASFTSKGTNGFAIHFALGAVGFVPSSNGGVVVCWVDATLKGTGELPTEKLAKLVAAIGPKKWRAGDMLIKGVGRHALAYRVYDKTDVGSDWLEIDLPVGDYEVHMVAPHKTPLGKLGFVRLTRVGEGVVAPTITKATATERARDRELAKRAKGLVWAETDGGPLVCMQEAVAKHWTGSDGKDYDRACSAKALFALLDVGGTQAIVLGYPNGTAWLELGRGRGMLVQALAMNSDEQMLDLALATAEKTGWKKMGKVDIGNGKLRVQEAMAPGTSPEHAVARITLPKGTYLVEYLDKIAASQSAQIAPVRLTRVD